MNQREASRQDWDTYAFKPSESEINSGSLQRIADATEKMALNYDFLVNDRNYYKRRENERAEENNRLYRRISALQGVITKLKKKLK